MRVWALVVAAGSGSRFATEMTDSSAVGSAMSPLPNTSATLPKQYYPLHAKPMLAHTLTALLAVLSLDQVAVVLSPHDTLYETLIPPQLNPNGVLPPLTLRCGGASRAASVFNGIVAIDQRFGLADDDWVLVHDAARPCVQPGVVAQMVRHFAQQASSTFLGGILACPLADTLKRGAPGAALANTTEILATPSRNDLWLAQTPQMFRGALLMQALALAQQHDKLAAMTDESMVMEWWCEQQATPYARPQLFKGPRDNIKVTYAEDLQLAEAILQAQSRVG